LIYVKISILESLIIILMRDDVRISMDEPLVSIIIPVFNGSNYLRDAIKSALDQTYKNCEILVINDGSNDNGATEAIAMEFIGKIKYIKKDNGGVATALNTGIKEMKGEYFSWLSHDDMYHPDKIQQELNAINISGDRKKIVFCDYEVLNVNTGQKDKVELNKIYPKEKLMNGTFSVIHGLIHGCSLLIHKSYFEEKGLFNEALISTQDYELWFRLLKNKTILFLDKPLLISRIHDEQGSKTIRTHMEEQSQLHINFIRNLDNKDIETIYENRYMFFYKMMNFYERNNIMGAYEYAFNMFMREEIPKDVLYKIKELKEKLINISNGNAKNLCIFCAGDYGIQLYHDLTNRLIRPDCFSDNNSQKWGYLIEGIYCLNPMELDKNNTLIIVSMKNPEVLVNELISKGFKYVITKIEIDRLLESVPPIKWILESKKYEKVDYSTEEMCELIDQFNQTLFEISNYYEGDK